MRPTDLITLQIYSNDAWYDYTEGLISADITRGVQEYTGPLTQPDVGQLTIKSKNPDLDPYNNPAIKYNALVRINAGGERIFTGKIDGLNVDYKPRNEDTVITLNVIDMLGTMYKHVLSDDFIANQESWTTAELLTSLDTEIGGFALGVVSTDGLEYADAPIAENAIALDALSIRAKTDGGFFFADARNQINYFRYDRYNESLPYNSRPVERYFDYTGAGSSYQTINLNDGFDKVINEVVINGTVGESKITVASSLGDSIALWGKASASLEVATINTTDMQNLANSVLTEMAEPIREIYGISYDATLDYESSREIDIYDNININHKVSETFSIDRKYAVIGIKHSITFDEWITTYVVRNFAYQSTSLPSPVITVTPEGGTQYIDYQFDYTHPNPELIVSQYWEFGDGITSTLHAPIVDWPTSGLKEVKLTVTTIYGYTRTAYIQVAVVSGPPEASFTYSVDANRIYQFTFTGENATSFEWSFGDGETSTLENPTHTYRPGGSVTVTLVATNSLGSNSTSQTFTALELLKIPVRYLRLRFGTFGNNPATYQSVIEGNSGAYWYMGGFKIYRTGNIAMPSSSWDILDVKELNGFFGDGPVYSSEQFDSYGRGKPQVMDYAAFKYRMTDAWGTGNVGSAIWPYYYSDRVRQKYSSIEMIIDLKTDYYDLDKLEFQIEQNISHLGNAGTIYVDVAETLDGDPWYWWGNMRTDATTKTQWGELSSTPLYASLDKTSTWDFETSSAYLPIRYVKVTSNTLSNPTYDFHINKFFPVTGIGQYIGGSFVYNTVTYQYPRNDCAFAGGIDTTRNTGGALSYPDTNTGTITGDTYYGAQGYQTINPGANNLTHWNSLNTKEAYTWNESTSKHFVYDLGQEYKKITGFYFDFRTTQGGTSKIPPEGFKFKIEVSADGISWTDLGEHDMRPFTTAYPAIIWIGNQTDDPGGGIYANRTPRNIKSTTTLIAFAKDTSNALKITT